jgi:ComF family protein
MVWRLHFCLVEIARLSDKRPMLLLQKLAKPILDYALPERCPACGVITTDGSSFCADCWPKLRFLNPPWCAACALPFAYEQDAGALCADCLAHPPRHDGVRAAVAYDDMSRQIALRLKYGGRIGLAKLIARQLLRHLPVDRGNIIVTPVPLHWTRLWSRSFNQSALIGQELARLGGMRYCADLLIRKKRTPSLRGLSSKERRKTVAKAFVVNPANKIKLKGARVILVDDVLTTGATSEGCIKILKKDGAVWVQLFCWARALRGEVLPENGPISLDA